MPSPPLCCPSGIGRIPILLGVGIGIAIGNATLLQD